MDRGIDRGSDPVRWWVINDAVPTVAPCHIPSAGWNGWEAHYTSDAQQGKRTTRRMNDVRAVATVLDELLSPDAVNHWCDRLGYAVLPDPVLWGGGLQVTGPGGSLAVHLDGDRHKVFRAWRRALSVIAYLHERWEPNWGGGLVLCDPDGGIIRRFDPLPGRLIAFENSDLAYHGVEPITGPAERVSLALSFLAPAGPANTRTGALFRLNRGT